MKYEIIFHIQPKELRQQQIRCTYYFHISIFLQETRRSIQSSQKLDPCVHSLHFHTIYLLLWEIGRGFIEKGKFYSPMPTLSSEECY